MATGRDSYEWNSRGLMRRDFRQDHGGGPEEIVRHSKRRNKRWCKGKEGREHRFEQKLRYSYDWTDSSGRNHTHNSYNWVCQGCGKTEWSKPPPEVPKHDHHFCLTRISESVWRKRESIWEECCVCGRRGRTYSYLTE